MEINFCRLKQKEVIAVSDGKNFGKVCDIDMQFPQNKIMGFFATGGKGLHLFKQQAYFCMSEVVCIGEDAVLVNSVSDCHNKQNRQNEKYHNKEEQNKEKVCSYPPEHYGDCDSLKGQSKPLSCCPRRDYDEYE